MLIKLQGSGSTVIDDDDGIDLMKLERAAEGADNAPREADEAMTVAHSADASGHAFEGARAVTELPPFEALYRTHFDFVWRALVRLGVPRRDLEDQLQEVFKVVYVNRAGYDGRASVRAWLFGIARRICARRVETRVRREQRLRLVHGDEGIPGADALLSARRDAERVRHALDQLKPSERDAVVLRYERDLSFREVGAACGVDEATARKRVSRALERLRSLLGAGA
jgi:RNA polymerase sigma-70 factor (ECF subfamily)